MKFIGYLPTEDVVGYSEYSEKIADIITQLGGKANAFGVVGDGLSFNNNTITIDTDVMATREWVNAQGYSSESITDQRINDLQHDVITNSANIATNKASIDSLTNDVANRYTKAEADSQFVSKKTLPCDGKDQIDTELRVVGNGYLSPLPRRRLIAISVTDDAAAWGQITVQGLLNGGWSSVGCSYVNFTYYFRSARFVSHFSFYAVPPEGDTRIEFYRGDDGKTYIYLCVTGSYMFDFDIKTAQADGGLIKYYESPWFANAPSGTYLGDNWSLAKKSGMILDNDKNLYYFGKTGVDSGNVESYVGQYNAFTYKYGRGVFITADSVNDSTSWAKAVFGEIDNTKNYLTVIMTGDSAPAHLLKDNSSGLAWKKGDFFGAITAHYYKEEAYLCGGFDNNPNWGCYLVLSKDGSNIADQTVKSFTATEVNHGCKFNGDLQSTSLTQAPKMSTHGKLQVSTTNAPDATKTSKTRNVRFGTTDKSVTAPMNAFMEYFFDHGYHFDNGNEGGNDSYDVGIVAYSNRIYYCVFQLNGDGSSSFTASPLETLDETGNSKFLLKKDGTAEGLVLNDNQLGTAGGNTLKLPEKSGTIATIGDFYDGLGSNLTNKALTANQGKVLDGKISSLSSSVDSKIDKIKFSGLATNASIGDIGAMNGRDDEDLSYSTRVYGGTYGRFYVFSALENGYNRNYGKLVVKTSSTGKADMTTNMVAGVSGETGYWNPQWLSVSVFVPAGQYYYLWGCRITKVYYSCIELVH